MSSNRRSAGFVPGHTTRVLRSSGEAEAQPGYPGLCQGSGAGFRSHVQRPLLGLEYADKLDPLAENQERR